MQVDYCCNLDFYFVVQADACLSFILYAFLIPLEVLGKSHASCLSVIAVKHGRTYDLPAADDDSRSVREGTAVP